MGVDNLVSWIVELTAFRWMAMQSASSQATFCTFEAMGVQADDIDFVGGLLVSFWVDIEYEFVFHFDDSCSWVYAILLLLNRTWICVGEGHKS